MENNDLQSDPRLPGDPVSGESTGNGGLKTEDVSVSAVETGAYKTEASPEENLTKDSSKNNEVEDKKVEDKLGEKDKEEIEEFDENLLDNINSISNGQIVEGTVVAITNDSVFVDIGYKSEGEIPLKEFKSKPSKGDKVKVMIVTTENIEGKLVLSKRKADELINWETILRSKRDKLPIEGKVTGKTKGGLNVDILGYKAFCPVSQIDNKKVADIDSYIGKVMIFKIDRIDGKNNIIVSRKKYLDEIKRKNIENFFNTKKVGDIVEGKVKEIVNYGAFIDLGDIDGLLHNSDISWRKVVNPRNYLNKGETIKCVILSMDKNAKKISLGIKQLKPDPWSNFEEKYKKGNKYKGRITKLTNFGAFVELEEGIEGLLHVSELSWTRRVKHPKEMLKVGDEVEVMLLDYNLDKRNLSLGLKQVVPNPWDDIDVRYPVNSKVKGKITRIAKFGVFIELEDGIEGLLHIDDISWTKPSKAMLDNFKLGDTLEVLVLDIDKENKKLKFGLKQLSENPWKMLKTRHPVGSVISGTITNITDFGVFVKIDEDIEGLIHISQLSNERVENPADLYKIGDEVKAVVVDINEDKRKVTLSIREYLNHLEYKEIEKYIEDSESDKGTFSLGSLIDLKKIVE